MRLLYCDESNLAEHAGDFLIYGGLMIDGASAREFSQEVDKIRADWKVPREFPLKFNPGPRHLTHREFISLKQALIESTAKFGAKLLIYAVLHDIARSPDDARRNGINTVCFHFDCVLNRLKEPGLVLIDRFNDRGNQIDAHLAERFSIGLVNMPYAKELRLSHILGFHYSAVGQSHFPSIVDILLGSIRFAFNAYTRQQEQHLDTAQTLMRLLGPLFYRIDPGGPVPELGLILSPKIIKAAKYRDVYDGLQKFLTGAGIICEQPITNERRY